MKIENDVLKEDERRYLNLKRDAELKGFVIDDILISEDILKTMSIKFSLLNENEKVVWIDINNVNKEFTKTEFADLIKLSSQKIEEIYFKYRKLKDELLS